MVCRSDFAGYYTAGLIIRQGNASRLYEAGEQARIQRQLFHREDLLINPHPPFEALCFAALATLSPVKAYLLWGAINVLLWLFFQHLLRRHTPIPRNSYRYFWLCSLFVPLWIALLQGQTTVLLLVLFSLTLYLPQPRPGFPGGRVPGSGSVQISCRASVCPHLLPTEQVETDVRLRRRRRCPIGAVSVMAVGPAGMRSYANLLIDIVRHPDNPAYGNMRAWEKMPTVKGFFATLLAGRLAAVYISVLVAAVSASPGSLGGLAVAAGGPGPRRELSRPDVCSGTHGLTGCGAAPVHARPDPDVARRASRYWFVPMAGGIRAAGGPYCNHGDSVLPSRLYPAVAVAGDVHSCATPCGFCAGGNQPGEKG